MKNIENTSWEIEFDKFLNSRCVEEGGKEEREFMAKIYDDKSYSINRKTLLNFIRNLLSAQRSNLVKEIEGLDWRLTKAEALQKILNLINSSK